MRLSSSNRYLKSRSTGFSTEGPLPEIIVKAYEDCYTKVKGGLPNFNVDPAWYDPEVHGVLYM